MDTLMCLGCVILLVSVEETLTQDQPSVKNPDDNKDNMVIVILLVIIALISVVAALLIINYYFCHRRARNTHESSKDTDASIPMVKVTGIGIDNVSSHCQTNED